MSSATRSRTNGQGSSRTGNASRNRYSSIPDRAQETSSSRTTRASRRAGATAVTIARSASATNSTRPSGIPKPAPTPPKDLDPNRRFNPDILLGIADALVDANDYKSLIHLSQVSRYLASGLKPKFEHLRKRFILRLDDLDLKEMQGWGSVKYIECSRSSMYPIDRKLPEIRQIEQKVIIQSNLKPSVMRYIGVPHECAFRLAKELFPTIKVIRFLHDPLSQNLSSVFGSTSTKVGETSLGLFSRMVPYVEPDPYGDFPPAFTSAIKVIEYHKKGFEYRDLNRLPARQIQSTIQLKSQGGLHFYKEDCENYGLGAGAMQSLLTTRYMSKHIKVLDRTDLTEILINVYMKPTPERDASTVFLTLDDGHAHGLKTIFDKVEDIARDHIYGTSFSTIRFQLFFIHGDSPTARTPVVRRPNYSSYEKVERIRHRDPSADGDYDEDDDMSYYGSDEDYDEDIEVEDETPRIVAQQSEQRPVYTLEFTKSGGRLRTTESTMDKDVLGCSRNGGCSRCRMGGLQRST